MIIVYVCVSVCILLGVQVQGHGGTDHNLKADTANTTYNGHTSAVSALTFGFLSPWPSETPAFAPVKINPSLTINTKPYRPSDLEKGRINFLFHL